MMSGLYKKHRVIQGMILLALVGMFIFSNPAMTHALMDAEDPIQSEQTRIQELMDMIADLQAQLRAMRSSEGNTTSPDTDAARCVDLGEKNMSLGSTDLMTEGRVTKLQQFLRETGHYTYGVTTGYFGPATERAVQSWQKMNGIVMSGSPETTGYGVVGPTTRRAMERVECATILDQGYIPDTSETESTDESQGEHSESSVESIDDTEVSELKILSRGSIDGDLKVSLRLPERYDGYYVVFMLNQADPNLSVSGGAFYGTTYRYNASRPLTLTLDVTQAHEGFANNPGGLHWFDLPSGKYKLGAVVYPKSPFKPGTEMEYMDVGKEPPAVLILNSRPYTLTNESIEDRPVIEVVYPKGNETFFAGETYTVRWKASNISDNKVDIFIISSDGTKQTDIANKIRNYGSYRWTVPNTQREGEYRFHVQSETDNVSMNGDVFEIVSEDSEKEMTEDEIEEVQRFLDKVANDFSQMEDTESIDIDQIERLILSAGGFLRKARDLVRRDQYEPASKFAQQAKDFSERALEMIKSAYVTEDSNETSSEFAIIYPAGGGRVYFPGEDIDIKWTRQDPDTSVKLKFSSIISEGSYGDIASIATLNGYKYEDFSYTIPTNDSKVEYAIANSQMFVVIGELWRGETILERAFSENIIVLK